MKPRERVQMALNHEIPDRCPMQLSFTPEFLERLKAETKLPDETLRHPRGGDTYRLDRALGADLLLTSVGWANSYYNEAREYVDEWGVGWRSVDYETKFGPGRYTDMVHHPLADDRTLANSQPPAPTPQARNTRSIGPHDRPPPKA